MVSIFVFWLIYKALLLPLAVLGIFVILENKKIVTTDQYTTIGLPIMLPKVATKQIVLPQTFCNVDQRVSLFCWDKIDMTFTLELRLSSIWCLYQCYHPVFRNIWSSYIPVSGTQALSLWQQTINQLNATIEAECQLPIEVT